MTYDIDIETMNRITQFEGYMDGTLTIKDYGRIYVVILDSNALISVNTYFKGNEYYTYYCDSGNYADDNKQEIKEDIRTLSDFINRVMYDISGDESFDNIRGDE
jgi:hypothetical protein